MKIEHYWVTPETVLYSGQRNSKQKVLLRKERELAKWQSESSQNIDVRKEAPGQK